MERKAAYAEAVTAALLALQAQFRHPDAEIARDAAVAIPPPDDPRLIPPDELVSVPLAPRVG